MDYEPLSVHSPGGLFFKLHLNKLIGKPLNIVVSFFLLYLQINKSEICNSFALSSKLYPEELQLD